MKATIAEIRAALEGVYDPELPVVRIVDLGVVEDVRVSDGAIEVDLLPTFSGCPALDIIRKDVEDAIVAVSGGRDVHVTFLRDRAWTTDRMNEQARAALAEFGVSPPADRGQPLLQIAARCPYCGSTDTRVEGDFGPTMCRDIRYCNACRNPFEGFKPK